MPLTRIWSARLALLALPLLPALLSVPRPARASLVEAMDLTAMTAAAQRIVVGEVLSVTSDWDAEHKRIYTTAVVQVAETWKGARGRPAEAGATGRQRGRHRDAGARPAGLPRRRARGAVPRPLGSAWSAWARASARCASTRTARRWLVEGGDRTAAFVAGPRGEIRAGRSRSQPAPGRAAKARAQAGVSMRAGAARPRGPGGAAAGPGDGLRAHHHRDGQGLLLAQSRTSR